MAGSPTAGRDLTLLIGMPGCGKSAWSRHHGAGAVVLSGDDLRLRRFGTNQDHSADDEILAELDAVFSEAVVHGESIVVEDALWPERRRRYITLARQHGYRVHAIHFSNYDQAAERNSARERRPAPDFVSRDEVEAIGAELEAEGYDSIAWVGRYDLLSPDRGGCSR